MNYVKKMCILRQLKQGFSGDGKPLSGLIKAEQYGKNLAVEVSVINFAPLSSGEYYCLLTDGQHKTEMLSLRGKSLFNILTDLDISYGFCGIICYMQNELVPIAYGINGNKHYDWRAITNSVLPPIFNHSTTLSSETAESIALDDSPYDDEIVAEKNYFKEKEDGQELLQKTSKNAQTQSPAESQNKEERACLSQDENADDSVHAFTTQSSGYFESIQREIDELFSKYPKDDTLKDAFACSDWIRIKGEKENPEYLVGVVYEDGKARYICYALKAQDKNNPPQEIADVCSFIPTSLYTDAQGFFVIFQSCATGECIKPKKT